MHEHEQAKRKAAATSVQTKGADIARAAQIGNEAVARLVAETGLSRAAAGPATLDQTIQRAIEQKRGSGKVLDGSARAELESAMGEDFSDVRIHTDSEAHALNQAVSAEAFATGSDLFFRDGKYQPESSDGRKLLAHELTHVVQQRGAPAPAELSVSEPDDATEQEASSVAEKVSQAGQPSAAGVASVSTSRIDREDDEQEIGMSRIDRDGPDPEEDEPGVA